MLTTVLAELPAPAAPVVWLQQPSGEELALSRAKYSFTDGVDAHLQMVCYVQADGDLAFCKGDPALTKLAARYRLDLRSPHAPTVTVRADLPRLYDQQPRLLHRPDAAELQAIGGTGRVAVLCRLGEDGRLVDCEPVEDTSPLPAARDYGSAFKAAALYRFKPATDHGKSVSTYQSFSIQLAGGAQKIDRPNWLRKPTGADLAQAFPAEAYRKGVSGSVMLRCRATTSGAVANCEAVNEKPEGFGFGAAALQLAPLFVMKPMMVDGHALEADVSIPIGFVAGGPPLATPNALETVSVMGWAPMATAPTAAQVAAAFPRDAAARHIFGHVVLLCRIDPSGLLRQCEKRLNTPNDAGFDTAAQRLIPLFKLQIGGTPAAELKQLRLTVAFDFSARALAADQDRYVRQLDWVRTVDPKVVVAAYPPEAVAAGVLSGGASVECRLDEAGHLTTCATLTETPPKLGFGASAVAVASAMQANLWTQDGEPTIGAKVRLPLKFVYGGERNADAPVAK